MIDFKKLFRQLNDRIDKPIEYNHILSQLIQDLDDRTSNANIMWIDGVPYINDPTRFKVLSMSRSNQAFSRKGSSLANCSLKVGETVTDGDQGVLMSRNGTITSLVVKSRSSNNFTVEIRKNNSSTPIGTLAVVMGQGVSDQLDIDFNQFDNIQLFIQGASIDHPIATLEWAWRN